MIRTRSIIAKPLSLVLLAGLLAGCAHDPQPFAKEQSLAEQEEQEQQRMSALRQQEREMEANQRQQAAAEQEEERENDKADNASLDKDADQRSRQLGSLNRTGVLPPAGVPQVTLPGASGVLR